MCVVAFVLSFAYSEAKERAKARASKAPQCRPQTHTLPAVLAMTLEVKRRMPPVAREPGRGPFGWG